MKKGFITNIETDTVENKNYRKVLYTAKHSQLVLMSLIPGEEIGEEIHEHSDQFFRFEAGKGLIVINGVEHDVADGTAVVVPAGAKHNVINTGDERLQLYAIYSPPHHEVGTLHPTKADETEEHWHGKTTENKIKRSELRGLIREVILEDKFSNMFKQFKSRKGETAFERLVNIAKKHKKHSDKFDQDVGEVWIRMFPGSGSSFLTTVKQYGISKSDDKKQISKDFWNYLRKQKI